MPNGYRKEKVRRMVRRLDAAFERGGNQLDAEGRRLYMELQEALQASPYGRSTYLTAGGDVTADFRKALDTWRMQK